MARAHVGPILIAMLLACASGRAASSEETSTASRPQSTALTASDMDAFRRGIESHWSVPPVLTENGGYRIVVRIALDRGGHIVGEPDITVSRRGGPVRPEIADAAAASVRRALLRSAPFTRLPPEAYTAWKDIIVNFDTADMR